MIHILRFLVGCLREMRPRAVWLCYLWNHRIADITAGRVPFERMRCTRCDCRWVW